MVVISAPSACTASRVHDLAALPSTRIVHAPHVEVSQPRWCRSVRAVREEVHEKLPGLDHRFVLNPVNGERDSSQGPSPSRVPSRGRRDGKDTRGGYLNPSPRDSIPPPATGPTPAIIEQNQRSTTLRFGQKELECGTARPMNLSETVEVLAAVADLEERGRPMALATIVSVTGSTYRRPGARLLIPDEGDAIGNLSGGCLEGQVTEIGRDVMKSGESRLEFYDLTADDEVVWGWGLGCNGAIEVFIEPAANAAASAAVLRQALEEERSLATVTVLTSSVAGVEQGARIVVYPNGEVTGSLGDDGATRSAIDEASRALAEGTTSVVELATRNGDARLFVEVLRPPLRLVVCGAGHDAIPLVRVGSQLGWRVDVVDDRAAFLDVERFRGARSFIECEPGDVMERADIDERSHVVVMSHNYLRDRDYLRSLLPSKAAYIGMLGPHVPPASAR